MESANCDIIRPTKYKRPGAASTARGTTPERLLLMQNHDTPTNNLIPYGYCHCGCGEKTTVPAKSVSARGITRGVPLRFINHHHARRPDSAVKWDESLSCYKVELTRGKYALVDSRDIDKVSGSRWSASRFGHGWYAGRNVEVGSVGLMHRLIMDAPDHLVVDHVSGDSLDNRRSNLRICTKAENNRNRVRMQSTNTSGYRGVRWRSERGRWDARIKLDGKVRVIGSTFLCPIEAAIARDVAALELHGEFATLNFPDLRQVFEVQP